MSMLLVDIGNTRVKWATLRGRRLGRMQAAIHANDGAAMRALVRRAPRDVQRVVVVSVAASKLERALNGAVRARFGTPPEYIRSARQALGVRNGYRETWRLGADRWVGVVAGFGLARGRPVVVANAGTALTIDAVDANGRHLGGAIVPGPSTMVASLLTSTHGIRRRARGAKAGSPSLFAADTRNALEAGALHAAAALIDRAVSLAKRAAGEQPLLIITGGAALRLRPLLATRARVVPDLVLRGLEFLARGPAR